jgi:regulator of sirC expression with transglutaminase-like and TPR domain
MDRGPLLRALAEDVPRIEEVALAVAADVYPGLNAAHWLTELDRIADPIVHAVAHERGTRAKSRILNERLFDELGFRGNEQSYYDPRNSYLNEVLERRVGIPISLAVVMMAVGRRVGLPIEGVGFPGHFLVRVGGARGHFADPFHAGKILSRDELVSLAERFEVHARGGDSKGELDPEVLGTYLRPVDERAIAVRMLANLKHSFERAGDSARALVVCDRLVDVTDEPHHRRDRGKHALALRAHRAARIDFAAYLRAVPNAGDAEEIQSLLRRATREEAPLN